MMNDRNYIQEMREEKKKYIKYKESQQNHTIEITKADQRTVRTTTNIPFKHLQGTS